MRVVKVAVCVAVLGNLLLGGASAFAAATPRTPVGGPVRVFVTPGNGAGGKIVIAGAIGDYGTTLNINKNGTADPNGNYAKATLRKGTFEVNKTALNAKMNNARPTVNNLNTCSAVISGTAPVTVLGGTGLYTGITGTVNITVTEVFVLPFYTSGKHKGHCNEGNGGQPVAFYESVIGTGTVSFS